MEISKRAKIQSDKPLYKEKKKTDKGYVWVYDEKTIQKRWKEKKDKIKKLQKGIEKLRKKYEKDLSSDDLRTKALAAVVAIMDETAMRIGNEDSARDAKTYGASTLKVKHLTFSGSKAKIKYVGKGGVDQETEVSGKKLISTLKELAKGKKDNDFVFEIDGTKIWDRAVNRYLNPFNISAKDLRGFHSNRLMKEQLKTKDWKEALEEVAELVGHKPATLKNQYLDPELVEKYENKKEAGISIRADQLTTTPMSQTVEQMGKPIVSDPELYAKQNIDINKNVPNISENVKMTPVLQQAWRIIAPFLPSGSKLTSGLRDDYDQIKIILENWLSWTPGGTYKKNQGFFHKNDAKSKEMEGYLRSLLYRAKQGLHGQEIKFSPRELKFIESLRQKMTSAEGAERLDIAPVGESWHLMGSALDIVGNFGRIAKAIQHLQKNYSHILPIRFHKYEPGNKAYHVEIGGQIMMPSAEDFAEMLYAYQSGPKLNLTKRQSLLISKRALLKPEHVKEIELMRQKQVSPSSISKRDTTDFKGQLTSLKIKVPANKLNKEILSTWYELQKLNVLPENAWMTSAIRTPEDQVRVIHNYWQSSGAAGMYPGVQDPQQMAKVLRSMGYTINNPESTPHSSGRSFDISGADLNEIANAVMQASRQTGIKMRTLIEENNNSVHVDILGQQATASVIVEESDDMAEDEIDLNSIYEDILASDAPKEILEAFRPETQEADDEPNKYEREKDDPKWKKPLLKDWTREEIRNHYAKNADKILKEIKGEPVMLYIGTDKDENILKRKHNDKPIVMDNKDDLMYWADRRLLSIHRVFGSKTKLGFVDLDVHGNFPKEKAKEYANDVAKEIKNKYGTTPIIYESGGSGYHIEFALKQEKDVDSLRNELRDMCEELNKSYEGFTTGIVKGAGVRTDTTTLKDNGNIRVPYAIHESKGGVKQPIGSEKKAFISVRAEEMLAEVEVEKPQVKLPEEQKGDIGFGKDDQMGDWFEKTPKFLERKNPGIELHDINESSAGQLANTEPDTFFYRGLHKTYPKLESDALKNMLKDNAKFYFVFKYHERPEEPFKALLQSAAEALSQQDVRAFFYYHLHHNFPELGRGAIIQLVDTNPDSFFDLGLDKDYPDYVESANNARNIKDPNKVELELDQLEQITSSMKISKRAAKKKLAAEVPDIQISDKEKQIFDILLGAIRHFGLKSTIRVAGGWVRDKVMGKNSKDIDIAVDNMSGKDFAEKALAYARMQGVPAKSVGVIEARPDQSKHLETAVVNLLDESIDFVNLRAEKYDANTRIPQMVPGTALEDAYRRDFTINALFYNINDGKVEDLTGTGVEDIKNGVIRTPIPPKEIWSQVGITDESQVINPKKTFMDDPLRILRAIRFASRYGFKLAPELMEAAKDPEVQESFRGKISRERIEAELRKMVAGPSPVWALQLIKELGLRSEVLKLPEGTKEWEMDQNNPHHQLNIWDHISETLGNLQQIVKDRNLNDADKFAVNLAAFLHDVGKLDPKIHGTKEIGGKIVSTYHGHEESSISIAEYMLKNLPGVRTEEIERIKKLIDAARRVNPERQDSSEIANMTRKQLGNFVRMIGDDWENAIDIAQADASAKKKDWLPTYNPTYYKSLKEQIKNMGLEKAHTMKPLLTGDELMKLFGRKGGKWVGVLNKELIQWQLENPTATKDDAIASAKQLYQQMDLAKSADFLISKRATEPTMEFKKEYNSQEFELPKYDESLIEYPMDSEEFGVRHIEDEELPPEMIVRPSLTDAEVLEQIKKDPTIFISYPEFAKRFPHLERMAVEEIAKRFPEVYFISNLQNNPNYQNIDEMALNNLLVSRPKLYFTMGLFDTKQFAPRLNEAMQSVAVRDPQFFLEVLLPLERFKDFRSLEETAKEALKKSRASLISKRAGVVDYPKQMHQNIMEWVKMALPGTAFADIEKRRIKPSSALRLAPVVIGDTIKEDRQHWANDFKEYTNSKIRLKKLILTAIESVNKQYRTIERDNWKQELDISTEDGNIAIVENTPDKIVLNINTLAPALTISRNENGNIDVKGDVGNYFFSSRMEYDKKTDTLTFDFIDMDWVDKQDRKLEEFIRSSQPGEFHLGEPVTKSFVINKLNDANSKDYISFVDKTSDQYAYMIQRAVASAIAFEDGAKATLVSQLAKDIPHVTSQESIIMEIDVSDTKQYTIIEPQLQLLHKNGKFKEVTIKLSRESSKQTNSAGSYNNNDGNPIITIIGSVYRLVNFLQEQSSRNKDAEDMRYLEEDFKARLSDELKEISGTIKHELVHMMQEIMRAAISQQKGKDIGMAGLPTYYNPKTLQLYKHKEQYTGPQHTLSDIEFYTNLRDEFANMKRDVISLPLSEAEISAIIRYSKEPLHISELNIKTLQKNRPEVYKYVMEQRFREFVLENRRLKILKENKPQYYEKMVRELYRELHNIIKSASISKRAKPKKHAKAGIFAVVPGDLAKGFPSLGDHDDSKPHVTVLFIGEVPKKDEELLEETVKEIVSNYEPFDVKLDENVSYFPASKHSDGCKIAKLKVISKDLHKFHDKLKEGISNAGIEIDDHFPDYKPHVTLEYMEPGKEKYDKDFPNGSWTIESVEIWNGDYRKRFRLGGKSISKRAANELAIVQDPKSQVEYIKKVIRHLDENLKTVQDPNHRKWLERKKYETMVKLRELEGQKPVYEWKDYSKEILKLQDELIKAKERLARWNNKQMSPSEIEELKAQEQEDMMPIRHILEGDVYGLEEQIREYQKSPEEVAEYEEYYRGQEDETAKYEATPPNFEGEEGRWNPDGTVHYYEQPEEPKKELLQLQQEPMKLSSWLSKRAKDKLKEYKKKREFDKTPEPEGKVESGKNKYRFVIQKHDADTAGLHFDLRLENDDGAMTSFAIPKHKLPTGNEKLFVQQTEDHPIEYNKFEGEIEEGYGKGHVDIHDTGTYELIKWEKDTIKFKLYGKKEKGAYTLHKTDGKKWMIMRMKEE